MSNIRNTLDKYVDEFYKNIKIKGGFKYNKDNPTDIEFYKKAVKLAYDDAARAFRGIKGHDKEKDNGITNLAEEVQKYFNPKEKVSEFDHELLCESFTKAFKDDYNKDGKHIVYGGAQKVVNLTFKYLYSCKDFRDEYKNKSIDKFKDCHMAIDSYILTWFKSKVDSNNECDIRRDETWSHLSEKKYLSIEEKIVNYVKNQSNNQFNVLEYEFMLWPNVILEKEAKSFLDTIKKSNQSPTSRYIDKKIMDDIIEECENCKKHSENNVLKNVL